MSYPVIAVASVVPSLYLGCVGFGLVVGLAFGLALGAKVSR